MKEFIFGKTRFKLINVIYGKIADDIQGHTHSRNSFELHYIEKGNGKLNTDVMSYELSRDVFYVTGPEVWHQQLTDKANPLYEYCLYFQCEESPRDLLSRIFVNQAFYYGRDNEKIRSAFEQAVALRNSENISDWQEKAICTQLIMNELVRLYAPELVGSEKFTPEDRKYIIIEDTFLYDYKSVTLSSLSERLGISERQTERLIKNYYGKTFAEKKTDARLEKAKLLLDKDMKIREIAAAVGYSDSSAFIKAYKRKFNTTPKNGVSRTD